MSECSNWLPLEEVNAGMVLAESLYDANGEVLLPAGATLSESTLATLRRRGTGLLPVVCDSAEEVTTEAEMRARTEALRHRIEHMFRRCGSEGANGVVLRCVLRYRTRQLT